MATGRSLTAAQSIASRAVHLQITPAPRGIRETREILNMLKGYGDVTMFRNLKYERSNRAKDAVLAVFRRPESAGDLLRASPIIFNMRPEHSRGPLSSIASAGLPELFRKDSASSQADSAAEEDSGTEFQILVDKSFSDHQAHTQRQTSYWGFPTVRSFAFDALRPNVPAQGLASMPRDNHQPELPSRIVQNRLEEVRARKSLRQIREEGKLRQETSIEEG